MASVNFRNNPICQADARILTFFSEISIIFKETPIELSDIADYNVGFSKQSKWHNYWLIPKSLAPCQKLAETLSLDKTNYDINKLKDVDVF